MKERTFIDDILKYCKEHGSVDVVITVNEINKDKFKDKRISHIPIAIDNDIDSKGFFIDQNKVIYTKPRMLCEMCFKEHCKGHGITKLINLIKD